MELTILGAGTAVPAVRRSPAGVLVRVGHTPLWFDMGPGTLARLAEAGVSYRDLNTSISPTSTRTIHLTSSRFSR